MCANAMELDWEAQHSGWFGYSEGPGPDKFTIYQCGCDEGHYTFVANEVDDPDYYEIRCRFIRECRT